ncbi:hypothetical protein K3495_g14046 [Podosphaera aphanis]|nr:hypothetical protein K3495_g14046 [Podosphaera aphanis]
MLKSSLGFQQPLVQEARDIAKDGIIFSQYVIVFFSPTGSQQKDSSKFPQDCHLKRVTLITSIAGAALATNLSHPLHNKILLDNGADGHICINLGLASSILENPTSPTFVQSGSGTSPIVGYGSMVFNVHLGNGKTQEITLTDVAFAPDFLTSVVS